jgi:CRISPR-associated protein Cas1
MRRTTTIAPTVAHLVGPGKLKVVNNYLAYSAADRTTYRLDPHTLRSVYCYGDVSLTDDAIKTLLLAKIDVALMSATGLRCRGRLVRADPSSALTRVLQHQAFAQSPRRLDWAKFVVVGKIDSMLASARHFQRHGRAEAASFFEQFRELRTKADVAGEMNTLRGLEGTASAAWFALFAQRLPSPWQFNGRRRRPPTDPVNALLSLGYTFLLQRAIARAEAVGLEIYVGGLHDYRAGRPSLACDLMEPLRVPAVDRWVIEALSSGRVQAGDFLEKDGGIQLQRQAFGPTIQHWEAHWAQHELQSSLDGWIQQLLQRLREWVPFPETADAEGDL